MNSLVQYGKIISIEESLIMIKDAYHTIIQVNICFDHADLDRLSPLRS